MFHTHVYTENKLKSKTTTNSNMVESESNNDIYKNYYIDHNNVINPYKIVEEEELKLLTNLCDCLSIERQ